MTDYAKETQPGDVGTLCRRKRCADCAWFIPYESDDGCNGDCALEPTWVRVSDAHVCSHHVETTRAVGR